MSRGTLAVWDRGSGLSDWASSRVGSRKFARLRCGVAAFLRIGDSEHREEWHRGSGNERRTAAAKNHKRYPSPRPRGSKGRPGRHTKQVWRSDTSATERPWPTSSDRPRWWRRAHGLRRRRCPARPRLRLLLLHQAGAKAATGRIAPPPYSPERVEPANVSKKSASR